MENLTNISTIKEILKEHNFTFSKALGQNFITNPSICPRIAEMGGARKGVGVIEVGPGIGVLSHELALAAEKVVCIELDSRLIPILAKTLGEHDNLKVIEGDVLKVDLEQIIKDEFEGMDVVVCANLPYYITTPIIMDLLEKKLPVKSITVMVQKEAAVRLCAEPGTRECGAVSAAIWYYSEPCLLFNVSAGSFMPAPEVDSAVIRLDVREIPPVNPKDEKLFFRVVKGAFSQRRKTAVNAISGFIGVNKTKLIELFEALNIPATIRAEKMTLEQFSLLSDNIPTLY